MSSFSLLCRLHSDLQVCKLSHLVVKQNEQKIKNIFRKRFHMFLFVGKPTICLSGSLMVNNPVGINANVPLTRTTTKKKRARKLNQEKEKKKNKNFMAFEIFFFF